MSNLLTINVAIYNVEEYLPRCLDSLINQTVDNYIIYAIMINTGTFAETIKQIEAVAPDQVGAYLELPAQLAAFSAFSIFLAVWERIFAVLFHTGASIMVFYACKDKKKFWLYPLAILLHTAMDEYKRGCFDCAAEFLFYKPYIMEKLRFPYTIDYSDRTDGYFTKERNLKEPSVLRRP